MADPVVDRLLRELPRPQGPFRRLEGEEARIAFERGRAVNRALHAAHRELDGFEIAEVHPALLAGDPVDLENKRAVSWETYDAIARFWLDKGPSDPAEPALPPCPPAPDLAVFGEASRHTVMRDGAAYLVLWPLETADAGVLGPDRPRVFASDGSGTAYAWGAGPAGDGVYELPFVPVRPGLARYVGPTVSSLLDRLGGRA